MTPIAQAFNNALLHFIWEGTAVAALLWIALLLLRKQSANTRYLASCAALAIMMLLPAVTTAWLYTPAPAVAVKSVVQTSVAASAAIPPTLPLFLTGWRAWMLPLW